MVAHGQLVINEKRKITASQHPVREARGRLVGWLIVGDPAVARVAPFTVVGDLPSNMEGLIKSY